MAAIHYLWEGANVYTIFGGNTEGDMRPFLIAGLAMLSLSGIGQAQRRWERSLQPFEVAAAPDIRIQPGTEALPRETVLAGRVGVAASGPFVALSAGWDEDGTLPENSRLRISTSKDSLEWSAWTDLPIDAHAVETRWQACTPTLFLPAGTRFYRLSITTNRLGRGRTMRRIELNFFDPGPTPPVPPPALQEPNAPDACPCDKPAVVTRAGWNCPQTNNPGYGYTTVTHLIVHHSAGANTSSDWPAVVLSIWNSHVNTNGWADIGYNYLIDPQGRLYEGRGGGDNVTGAHFCGTNGGTMGTCMLGTYTSTSVSDTARSMLTRILAWKACGSSINPTGSSWHASSARNLNHISGHRDGCATECPGNMTYAELPALRTAVANHIAACNTPTAIREVPGLRAFRITPNPVRPGGQAIAHFDLAGAKNMRYDVYSMDGRLLHASKNRQVAGRTSIPIQGLEKANKGAVFLVFRLDNAGFTHRLVLD
jgi:hypothetical protein